MNRYLIDLKPYGCPLEFILYHEKELSGIELQMMMVQTVKEMKWNGIRRTFGNEMNYMIQTFGFWIKD